MNKKIISLCLASTIALSMLPTTVFAASVGSIDTDKNIGEDIVQGQKTYYSQLKESNAETEVYLTVDESELLVSVPTTIIIDGEPNEAGEYTADYSVGVKGDISGTKTVTVMPESNTVALKQVGKDNKEASVLQAQTDFTQTDFRDETITTGHLSAPSLTAGAWNGTFDFLINVNQIKNFYSSLNLAAEDINAQTVATKDTLADLATAQGAVCGVYKTANETKLVLLKDVTDQTTVSLTQPVKINLNHYSVTFADGQYLTSSTDLTVVNGNVNVNNSISAINVTGGTNFVLNSVEITAVVDEILSNNTIVVAAQTQNNIIENCKITGTQNMQKGIFGFYSFSGINKILNSVVSIKNTQDATVNGIAVNGSLFSENNVVSISGNCGINAPSSTYVRGVASSVGQITSINDTINVESYGGAVSGLNSFHSGSKTRANVNISNGNFTVKTQATDAKTKAKTISVNSNANIIITSGHYNSYGSANENYNWGLVTGPKTSLTVNNAYFYSKKGIALGNYAGDNSYETVISNSVITSDNHALYVGANATVNDSLIYNTGGSAAPIYFGSSTCPEDAVLNLNRCTLGNPNATTQKGLYTIVSTRNYGYKTGAEVNITDCDLYQSSSVYGHMFSYHNNFKDGTNLNQTKFNLYGDTKLYKEYDSETGSWVEYSKDEVASFIDPSWKTAISGSSVGNKLVWSPNCVVTDGVLVTNNLTDDAGVYDYRD